MRQVIDRFDGEYAFLSNFYESPIVLPGWHPAAGHVAPTVEHAFQAAKTVSYEAADRIIAAPTPGQAKRLGRHALIREGWDTGRDVIMLALLQLKFARGSELAGRLLATGNAELIEGNTWGDTFWGVCGGVGQNRLGELLMHVRSELRGAYVINRTA